MDSFYIQYQAFLAGTCILGLIGIAALLFAAWTGALQDTVRRWTGLTPMNRFVVCLSLCLAAGYAVSKYQGHITYDGGIAAATTPNDVTNDLINIYWQRDPKRPVPLPLDSTVYIDYRPIGNTNDWGLLGQTTVGAWAWHGTLPDATNYDYNVWAYYIPPAPHTNGVWEWKTTYSRDGKQIVPFHARIEFEGKAIFGPDQKRKDNP